MANIKYKYFAVVLQELRKQGNARFESIAIETEAFGSTAWMLYEAKTFGLNDEVISDLKYAEHL